MIKRHENDRKSLSLHKCSSGKWTIGYGHNLEDNGISESTAEFMLSEDIETARRGLKKVFTNEDLKYIDEVRFNALVDMMFQLGLNKFRGFKNMTASIKVGDWLNVASHAMDSKWYKQCPNRASEIVRMLQFGY